MENNGDQAQKNPNQINPNSSSSSSSPSRRVRTTQNLDQTYWESLLGDFNHLGINSTPRHQPAVPETPVVMPRHRQSAVPGSPVLMPPHQYEGFDTTSVLGSRVQSAARGQNSNLFSPQDYASAYNNPNLMGANHNHNLMGANQYGLMGQEYFGPMGSGLVPRDRVPSGSRGQTSNFYGLAPDDYALAYHNANLMSSQNGFFGSSQNGNGFLGSNQNRSLGSSQNGFAGSSQNGFFGRNNRVNMLDFDPSYYCNPMGNTLNGLLGLPGSPYNPNNRVNSSFPMGSFNPNSFYRPESMYAPNGPRAYLSSKQPNLDRSWPYQPDRAYGLGRGGMGSSGRPNRTALASENLNLNLNDCRGGIKEMVKNRLYSNMFKKKIEAGAEEDLEIIFEEIKDDVARLMMNYCSSMVVQTLFKACTPEQITYVLRLVIGDKYKFLQICCDNHGSVAMEKLLERVTVSDEQMSVLAVLRGVSVKLAKDQNAHRIVQHCLAHFPRVDAIIDEIAVECFEISTHKSGCCILQTCLDRASPEQMDRLMIEIGHNVVFLSEHEYGNYVVQYLLGKKIPRVTSHIIRQLFENYVGLSMNKCASNVVEKCITFGNQDESTAIIFEIMDSEQFLLVLQSNFGNFVVQKALEVCQQNGMREIHQRLEKKIGHLQPYLHSHPYGNRVLSKIKNRGGGHY